MATRKSKNTRRTREGVADITEQLAALRSMTVAQLRERYLEVTGEPTRSRNKDWLFKKIAWRIQELAEGGLSEQALASIDELAGDAPVRWRQRRSQASAPTLEGDATDAQAAEPRDPRLPPAGTVLTRDYKGVEHKLTVLDDGFEYRGERHASLSKLAKDITGTNWNGFLFWGLQQRRRASRVEKG